MINPAMKYDNAGFKLTETFEGLSLTSYWDSTGKVWTIGYGHTGREIIGGLTWTQAMCEDALAKDIFFAERVVNNLVTVSLNQHQFDALVDFVYNAGAGNFAKSTLLALVNKGDFAGADLEFTRWVYSGNRILGGLVTRRKGEAELFLPKSQMVV